MRSKIMVPDTKVRNGEPIYPDALVFSDNQEHLKEYDGPMAWLKAWRTPFTIGFFMGEGATVSKWGDIENSDESYRFHRAIWRNWSSWRSVRQKDFTPAGTCDVRNEQGSLSELS
jgi:hypothetical protein